MAKKVYFKIDVEDLQEILDSIRFSIPYVRFGKNDLYVDKKIELYNKLRLIWLDNSIK